MTEEECAAMTIHALSIQQPWAWLVVNGHKDVENRSWPTRFRGEVLIHAGKKFDPDVMATGDWPWPDIKQPDDFNYGGIVGTATVVGCVTASRSPWFVGPFGFLIRNAKPLPFLPCRGRLGFFLPDFSPPPGKQTSTKAMKQATFFT
jgi:hypothetical protein